MPEEFDAYRKWLGIPPEDQPPNHYRLLGISLFEDDPDVVENAADRQMAHVRTFQSGKHGRLAHQILNELSAAKVCLLNAAKKTSYDAALRGEPEVVSHVEEAGAEDPPAPPPRHGVQTVAAPIVVSATSPARRPAASTRTSRGKKNSHTATIAILVVCAILLVGAIAGGMNLGTLQKLLGPAKSKGGGDSKRPQRDTSTAPAPVGTPDRKLASKSSGDKTAFTPPKLGDGFQAHPTIPPLKTPSKAERAAAFQKALDKTREAMEHGYLESAQTLLIEADAHKATARDQADVLHLRTLNGYLGEFWYDVRKGVDAVEIGKPFEFHGDQFELLQRDDNLLTYKSSGEKRSGHVRELEGKAALAFAAQAPDSVEARSLVYAATFLAFSHGGNPQRRKRQLELARQLWHEAARQGLQDVFLAKELGIDRKVEPEMEPQSSDKMP